MLLFEILPGRAFIIEKVVFGVGGRGDIASLRHIVENYFVEGSALVG